MSIRICKHCGEEFKANDSQSRPIKFCCSEHYNRWRKGKQPVGGFEKSHKPWNRGLKGIHLSPESEFKKGHESNHKLLVGTETIRSRYYPRRAIPKRNDVRAWVKVAEPNIWKPKAQVVWEEAHGIIPNGKILHHKNGDTLDDRLANLELVSRSEHINLHRPEFETRRRIKAGKAIRGRWKQYRHHVVKAGKCECGNLATVGMRFQHVTPRGKVVDNYLILCNDCYEFELAEQRRANREFGTSPKALDNLPLFAELE